jgi:hypothetical protein
MKKANADFLVLLNLLYVGALTTVAFPAGSQDDIIGDVFGEDSAAESEPVQDTPVESEEAETRVVETRVRRNHGSGGVDLGLHVSGGVHQCIRSGTNYVACKGADGGWDLSWGVSGGFLVRPYKYFSVRSRWEQELLSWADFSVGPVARLHVPFNIMRVTVEPNLGVQVGYVQGNMRLKMDNDQRLDRHMGLLLAAMAGVDFFVIPEFGFGLETRLYRTLYQEACFDGPDGPICRGENNEAAASCVEQNCYGDEPAEYPWKIFYGGRLLYYF